MDTSDFMANRPGQRCSDVIAPVHVPQMIHLCFYIASMPHTALSNAVYNEGGAHIYVHYTVYMSAHACVCVRACMCVCMCVCVYSHYRFHHIITAHHKTLL